MSEGLTRRTFLKLGMGAATATALSGCTVHLQRTEYLESYVKPPEEALPGESTWYATACRQCSAGCGMIVRVSNGRARKCEGNPMHPINRGKLCAQGQATLQELYDPDRLRNAVRQTGGRGSALFQAVYWTEALQSLTDALRAAGPGGVAFLGGNSSSHLAFIVTRLLEAMGAPPPVFYNVADEYEGVQAMRLATQQHFGAPSVPYYDLANADVVFSFGATLLDGWPSPMLIQRQYADMRRRPLGTRGYLAQIEPRFSATGTCADERVPVHSGTEGLLALAIGKIILDRNEARQAGTEALFGPTDVAAVATATGVPAEQIERLARIFARGPAQLAIPGNLLAGFANRTPAMTAVQALNVMMGRLGQPGGVFLPPVMDWPGFAPAARANFGEVQKLIDRMTAGEVKLLLVHGANPVFELPTAAFFGEALRNVQTMVSFSPAVDETAVQADLVLPDHTNLESWGYQVAEHGDRRAVSAIQPVMNRLHDTQATADVFLAVAQSLGGAVAAALPWRNEVEFLRAQIGPLNTSGVNPEVFWATWRRQGGWWAQEPELRTPQAVGTLGQAMNVPPPVYEGSPADPLVLQVYPTVALGYGRGANKAWLQETPDPMTTVAWQTWVEINPRTAERLGVSDGDIVRVGSAAGNVEAVVYVYPGINENVVGMPIGRGHDQYGRFARGKGSNPIRLLVPAAGSDSGILDWGATRVNITRTGRSLELARLESPAGVEYVREAEFSPEGPTLH